MRTILKVLFIALLITSFSTVAHAQKAKYNSLNKRMAILFKNGRSEEAIKVAEEVIEVAKTTFGKTHAYVSASLENLALLHLTKSNYKKAEQYYLQSLNMRERLLGKNHPRLIKTLEKLEKCYEELDEIGKAERVKMRIEELSL